MARRRRVRRDGADLVRTQPGSGLTVWAFCQQAGVSCSQFYRWRRWGVGAGRPAGGFVQLQPVSDQREPAPGVALVSPQGWRLEVAGPIT